MQNCLSRALACACFVALVVIVKHAETAGAVLRHKVDWQTFEAAGWEVVSLDIVSKFEPTILCDIRSWDYALFPPGHFDMVWASPVCTEHSRALTMRPRRLEEGDALVLRALEIMEHFDPLMWVIENPATGLLKPVHGAPTLHGRHLLQVRDSVQEADLETEPRAMQERRRCNVWEDGRHLRGAQGGPRLMGGQRERVRGQSRELLCSIPTALCEEIARAATAELGSAPGLKHVIFFRVAELYTELHEGNSEKKPTCSSPVPNSTRAGPEKMGHACFQFRTLRGHFFLSRHALRRRPISRPTWHSATARRLRLRTLGRTCS